MKDRAAVRLQTTWNKIHQRGVVLWMDNWYNKEFTTSADKNDKSLNATALAVLLLRDAPRYWHGHLSLEELEPRVPIVMRMLRNTEATFARILRDLGFASTGLLCETSGHRLILFARCLPGDRIGGLFA